MIKIIKQLSKIFIIDYFQKLNIFKKEDNKINYKSGFVWLLIILILAISYSCYEIISFLNKAGQEILFLKIYLPIISFVIIFQAILIISNILYFSKDTEYILYLPIKPEELIISKLINIISIIYSTGIILIGLPLLIYGMVTGSSIYYYLSTIIVTFIFPILPVLLISFIMLIIVQSMKFIKNKGILQILIVSILTLLITTLGVFTVRKVIIENFPEISITEEGQVENAQIIINTLHERLNNFNKYFFNVNNYINILSMQSLFKIIIEVAKIILINIFILFIFLYLSKKIYINLLLKNTIYINNKIINNKKIKNNYNKNKINKTYIINELKKIIRTPTFFLQCIFQYLFMIIIFLVLLNTLIPTLMQSLTDEYILEIGIDNFKLQIICILLGIIQLLSMMNNLSITAISREGKYVSYLKCLPVSLYDQFKYKNIPQILLNTIAIAGTLIIWKIKANNIEMIYIIITFIIAMILNIINSYLMLITNLRKPNIDWITETSALKDNGSKLIQYGLTIINILMLNYFTQIFENMNINISLLIILAIYLFILIIIINYTKRNINKLFNKIN